MPAAELAIIAPTPPPRQNARGCTRHADPDVQPADRHLADGKRDQYHCAHPGLRFGRPRRQSGGLRLAMAEGFAGNGWPDKWQLGVNQESSSKALRIAKVPVMSGQQHEPLPDEWAALYARVPDDHGNGWKASLGRLISYCSDNDYLPDVVCDRLIEQFECTRSRPQVYAVGRMTSFEVLSAGGTRL